MKSRRRQAWLTIFGIGLYAIASILVYLGIAFDQIPTYSSLMDHMVVKVPLLCMAISGMLLSFGIAIFGIPIGLYYAGRWAWRNLRQPRVMA